MDFASTDIGICSRSNLANESIERARNALQRFSCRIRKPADSRHFGTLFGDIVSRLKTCNKAINLSQTTSSLLGQLEECACLSLFQGGSVANRPRFGCYSELPMVAYWGLLMPAVISVGT